MVHKILSIIKKVLIVIALIVLGLFFLIFLILRELAFTILFLLIPETVIAVIGAIALIGIPIYYIWKFFKRRQKSKLKLSLIRKVQKLREGGLFRKKEFLTVFAWKSKGRIPYYIALFGFISMVVFSIPIIKDIWGAIILSAFLVGLPTVLYYMIIRIKNDNRKRKKGWYLAGAGCFILLGGWLLVCSLLWINILLTKKVLTRNLAPNETPAYYIALVISIPIVILCFYGAYTFIKRIERDKKEGKMSRGKEGKIKQYLRESKERA